MNVWRYLTEYVLAVTYCYGWTVWAVCGEDLHCITRSINIVHILGDEGSRPLWETCMEAEDLFSLYCTFFIGGCGEQGDLRGNGIMLTSSCPCRLGDLEVAGDGMMLPPRMIMTNPMFVTVSSNQTAYSASSLVLPAQCTQGFIYYSKIFCCSLTCMFATCCCCSWCFCMKEMKLSPRQDSTFLCPLINHLLYFLSLFLASLPFVFFSPM